MMTPEGSARSAPAPRPGLFAVVEREFAQIPDGRTRRARERGLSALILRSAGLSFTAIARQLQYRHASAARNAVMATTGEAMVRLAKYQWDGELPELRPDLMD